MLNWMWEWFEAMQIKLELLGLNKVLSMLEIVWLILGERLFYHLWSYFDYEEPQQFKVWGQWFEWEMATDNESK